MVRIATFANPETVTPPMTCPSCSTAIPIQNINIHTDVGQCSACGFVFRVSDQLDDGPAVGFDLDRPPIAKIRYTQ